MANLNLSIGEAVFTGSGEALSGGSSGEDAVVGADDHGAIELRAGDGKTLRASIGGVEAFSVEVVNGVPVTTFKGPVKAMGFEDTTPQAPSPPRL